MIFSYQSYFVEIHIPEINYSISLHNSLSNRTHLPLTTACSTAMLASLFIPVKLKVRVWLERPS